MTHEYNGNITHQQHPIMNKSKVQSTQSNMWKIRKAVMMKRKRTDKGTRVKQAEDYRCTEH